MIPELGHFALWLAVGVTLMMGTLPMIGAQIGRREWMALGRPASRVLFALVMFSFLCLAVSFAQNDFSVLVVASHSNTALPLHFRLAAVWGSHEGSMLLWLLMQAGWALAVATFSSRLPEAVLARILAVMGLLTLGFLLFVLLTSNPFDRLFPTPLDGRDLNPQLQDPGMIFHPPMLFMGYVGFSVAFAFAVAALIGGNLDAQWARWTRPWTTVAWMFLTVGIAMGSWWAYYELGWGGWWFWDPVENASFMPWLVGTALIHSLAVTEKRGSFKSWTVLLAIMAFSLSLLGTFLVRSGVLTSVHSFASDPRRGLFILGLLALTTGAALALYAWRAPKVGLGARFSMLSRETLLLANNVLLVVAAAAVMLGTLYPLILDALDLGKISVGPPYFDTVFVPLMTPLVFLMGVGPLARWKHAELPELGRRLRWAAAVGMMLALFGVAVFIFGVTMVHSFQVERDVKMRTGDSTTVSGYTFTFKGVQSAPGPNFQAARGHLEVTQEGRKVTDMYPEKRVYTVQRTPMTEAAINTGFTRDLYVSLGEIVDEDAWIVRVYFKPFIDWVWGGCLLMALGGLLAVSDRRYRMASRSAAADRQQAMAGA